MSNKGICNKRGAIWISAVIYALVAVTALIIVLEAGLPFIKSLQERSAVSRARSVISSTDQQIVEVAREGQGSQRVVPFEVADGEVKVENNMLTWKIETASKILEPRTRVDFGNIKIASDIDVSSINLVSNTIIQNSRILANFTKLGSKTNWTSINTSGLINFIEFKATGAKTNGTFSFFLNQNSSSAVGTGYTELLQEGNALASATLKAHVNSTIYDYDLLFTLDSKADFLRVEVENLITR